MQSQGLVCTGYMSLGSPKRPGRDTFKEHLADMLDPVIQEIARETGVTPARVLLELGLPAREQERRLRGDGDALGLDPGKSQGRHRGPADAGTDAADLRRRHAREHPGIDANNRLIWGQVFLWPEADGDWRVLWNDSQVFETRAAYQRFKTAWEAYRKVWSETTYRV